ncbi:MAG: SET domain-containing protein [Promethearchaeota archaeon]|jgi:SET domain-containing protein
MNNNIPYNNSPHNPIKEFTEVKTSKIHGIGLFAKKLIPKGKMWWHARPEDVLILTKKQFLTLDNSQKTSSVDKFMQGLLTYAYYDEVLDALVFCLDNSRFVNHSLNPNSGTVDEHSLNAIASRDIQPGEEITENYLYYVSCDWLQGYREFFDPNCW